MSEDEQLEFLCHEAEVSPGQSRRVEVTGYPPIAVFNVGGNYYATNDYCTHGKASLTEGALDGETVECPFHGGQFNVRTGAPVMPPCVVPLRTWVVIVRDGDVLFDPRASARVRSR